MTAGAAGPRVAVVTGGSRGIGAATCRLLAAQGWDVAVGYRSASAAAGQVVDDCLASGRRAVGLQVDVADEPGVRAFFAAVDDQLGPLGALVNNAGIVDRKARVDEVTAVRLERMFAVNVTGSFLCAREAVLRMSSRYGGAGGVVVNVSSAASRLGSPGQYVDYAASKGAVDTMTLGLAKEVATEGVRVNAVRPGVIDTEIHASGGQPGRAQQVAPLIPMGREGQAAEVAAAIAWLCSPAASYVTGALLDVSGGR